MSTFVTCPTPSTATSSPGGEATTPSFFSSTIFSPFQRKKQLEPPPLSPPARQATPSVVTSTVDHFSRLANFERVRVLGEGTFGRVYLVRNQYTRQLFALKVMKKETIIQLNQITHVHNEKQILAALDSGFAVKLFRTYQDEEALYLLLEFVVGGEFFHFLRMSVKLPFEAARFYAAEIVVALDHMHTRYIAYRDLKPENILIARDGHVKLCDFGFAKFVTDRTWTLCGTPEYLAPEVIKGEGHDHTADWWSLGILIYEMMVGYPPFYDVNPLEIYKKALKGTVPYPPELGPNARSLVSQLLEVNKTKRLGASHAGAKAIKAHPYFLGVNWELVERKLQEPPWRPPVPSDPTIPPSHVFPSEDEFEDFGPGFGAPAGAPRGGPVRDPEFLSLMRTAFVNF